MTSKSTMIVIKCPAPKPQYNLTPLHHTPPQSNAFQRYEKEQAEKRNITVEEYLRRCSIVRIASNSSTIQTGDTVYPRDPKNEEEHGPCKVMDVCRHYNNYGDVAWHEPPLILTLRPSKGAKDETIMANTDWCVKRPVVTTVLEEPEGC